MIDIKENDDLTIVETQLSTLEETESTKGNFVIKRKPSDKAVDIVREIDIEQLLLEYPALEDIKGIDKMERPLLYISEQAEKEIKKHISWDKKTSANVNEQGGILIGKPFLGIVECVIPGELSQASAAYLEMGTETWGKMLDVYDENYKDKGLFVIGWFHTHPNSLSVFMSFTDMGTQRGFFNQDWHFSIVLNPHRRLIACFNSVNADKCDYYPPDFVDR